MLEFDTTLIAYEGNDNWVEETIQNAHDCLIADKVPGKGEGCDYCGYREAVSEVS